MPLANAVAEGARAGDSVAALLDDSVAKGRIAGVVSVASVPGGDVRFDCAGYADLEKKTPVKADSLFAIFSMTKPFNGAAIMAAIDDGLFSLDDEVAKYLPEFASVTVAVTNMDGTVRCVLPKRPITIRDLVTHTSGSRCQSVVPKCPASLRETARRVASEPFAFQPGETFSYGNAWVDASAAALEVAVGMPYERWLRLRVLDPLGMADTTFYPDEGQRARLVKPYTSDDGPLRPAADHLVKQHEFPWDGKVYPCAAGGLYSTPADIVRFAQMLAGHGTWRGRQIISRRTFDTVYAVKQTPREMDVPYGVGCWVTGDWIGHEGAMRTDVRANLKTGQFRAFFIQTENKAGPAFFSLKKAWEAACDGFQ